MKNKPKDISTSIRARLLNLSRQNGEEFQYVLTRYAGERLLYRLGCSPHRNRFILKGATLFIVWSGTPHRETRDLDLLGSGEPLADGLLSAFREVCSENADDGLLFLQDTMTTEVMREDEEYRGLRLKMTAMLGTAKIPVQVDVGFGDAVTPEALETELPTSLGLPAARLRAYPRETVVAEKLHVIAKRGMSNSRLKDYFDLWHLLRNFEFGGATLSRAIRATFSRRETELPQGIPAGLSYEYTKDPGRVRGWRGFLSKSRLDASKLPSLDVIGDEVAAFVLPVLTSLFESAELDARWDSSTQKWKPERHD